jgi:hypothetical protein
MEVENEVIKFVGVGMGLFDVMVMLYVLCWVYFYLYMEFLRKKEKKNICILY